MDFYFQPNGQPSMGNGQMVSGHSGHTLNMPNGQQQQHHLHNDASTMHSHHMLDANGNHIIPAVVSPPNNFDAIDCSPDALDCQIKDEQFGFTNPAHQQQQQPQLFDMNNMGHMDSTNPSNNGGEIPDDQMQANELDDDLTTKRKAQNRAAQRAFRERREQRLKELEDKVAEVEQERERLASENERLKRENTVITTENKVLMETAVSKGPSSPDPTQPPIGKANFPYKQLQEMRAKTQETILGGHEPPGDKNLKIIYQSEVSNDTMLGAAAVWDTIAKHAEEEEFDIDLVAQLIQGHQRCEGFGPVFPLKVVEDAIREAIRQYV
ncbi:hypothetical protein B0I72DRAFT_140296 [Yarrowia lipolytica]|jgi:hypothetical protein|uniref:YALI0D09757p n=2 Tax=Yarrowia lipolytica TaxID=4952 RepID=Q6C9N3_YARLI|nr:YALI0D09757p [Yarrowia lipolytica CLIB122]AOW03844.1 hypothetical protein YALI1_D12342g [Yarrowia lipolytica]KAB8283096.1 hypothetical protein BKA91DRAFT_137479 [Yarrowia lipolytica]KAE8170003.1 hypothetical protein BKA90DRAFT_141608 [Yarrowia lipolytica]KAJ8054579.1 hypothetical protein LXG23DRAFT_36674 [Yarrowia lipolytica]QNP97750.1 Hypothetical protein YALI2_D00191g [Yarrowia lipolytica]|eukprot:XP_502629.1 YALI0D09757p [Yarrowia lipolytica CLIB122]